MKLIDVSLPLSASLPVWPGDPHISIVRKKSLAAGDHVTASHLSCNVHAGTHVDAPAHFLVGGSTVDQMPLGTLIGPAYVASIPDAAEITPTELKAANLPLLTERLLLRTRNSKLWRDGTHSEFNPDFVALTPQAAEWLVERKIKLVGIDYLSVQRFSDADPATHQILLGSGIIIIEGLDLHLVAAGRYQLICLPLKLAGSEGAPARAVLVQE